MYSFRDVIHRLPLCDEKKLLVNFNVRFLPPIVMMVRISNLIVVDSVGSLIVRIPVVEVVGRLCEVVGVVGGGECDNLSE